MAADSDAGLHHPADERIRLASDALTEFRISLQTRGSVAAAPIGDVMLDTTCSVPRCIEHA